jgi:hypothetical protein
MLQNHTAMAAALRAAGYLDAEARLIAAAVDAWAKHPAPAAADQRRAHVAEALGDGGCYRMIRRHNAAALARLEAAAANELLADARETIAAQRPVMSKQLLLDLWLAWRGKTFDPAHIPTAPG